MIDKVSENYEDRKGTVWGWMVEQGKFKKENTKSG